MSEMIDFSSALQRAFDLGDKAATAQYEAQNRPNIIEHDGAAYLYFNGKLTQIEPAEIYHPETFYASTLEGLCDYIQADSDEQFVTGQPAPLVVVESPVRVNVYGVIVGEKKERPLLASCEYEAPEIAIGQYIDAESLFINIQSCFVADENRDLVCKVVNNMTEEQSVQTADDGISQRVILKAGVQEVDKTIFRNPAFLRPMRSLSLRLLSASRRAGKPRFLKQMAGLGNVKQSASSERISKKSCATAMLSLLRKITWRGAGPLSSTFW